MPDRSDRLTTKILDAARRKLLETGTRNRLIHVNRANQRVNCLGIINERSDDVFTLLRDEGKRMRFKATGRDRRKDEAEAEDQFELLATEAETDAPAGPERYTDQFLETPLGPEAQARRLLRLASDARTAEEEQGLNILYLALGFLKWRESGSSDIWREAPLVLLPVELVRNERTSTYDIRAREDDITTNLPLQERLRQDFGIILPDIDEGEDWKPSAYYAQVRDAVSGQSGWAVDADGMQLGFFSFAKLLMHRDLDPASWPDGELTGNDLLSGLLAEGFDGGTSIFGPEDKLDVLLDPADIIQVVDADASQTKVIEEVRRGSNLVVQGPPGTGKSQTITNLIAAAAHDGKSVLFVAEKMAALSVVHHRLVRSGLRDVCLELHSRSANKKALAQELGRTLMASASAVPNVADADALRQDRDALNRISDLLHKPSGPPSGPTGDTPFRAMAEIIGLIGKGAQPPSIPLDNLDKLSLPQRRTAAQSISRFVEALAVIGAPEAHPFRGVQDYDLQPTDLLRLEGDLSAASTALNALLTEGGRIGAELARPAPLTLSAIDNLVKLLEVLASAPEAAANGVTDSLFERVGQPRLKEALSAGADWAQARAEAEPRFADQAWATETGSLRSALAAGQSSFWARLFGPYRKASASLAGLLRNPLPKSASERLDLIDQLASVQGLRRRLSDDEAWLQATLGENWRGERTDFAGISNLADWLEQVKSAGFVSAGEALSALAASKSPADLAQTLTTQARDCEAKAAKPIARLKLNLAEAELGGDLLEADLAELAAAFDEMRTESYSYSDWAALARAMAKTVEAGAGDVIDAVADGRVQAEKAVDEFTYGCAEARWNAARQAEPELSRLAGLDRHELVRMFQAKERARLNDAQSLILARQFAQIPRGSMGEMGVIRGEIGRKSRHKPIRWVMKNAGSMVQRIKPVMLMSPISVAQFLPPGTLTFDLLVIDEASQIRPEDALGVIARARQIVVVGDQKQLPPTSFFDRLVDEADDAEEDEDMPAGATAADMESILSLCEARGLRSRMLEWHYRSRDPSLIRVSNAEFYGDNLVLPPSPLQLDPNYGLKFRRVPGVYARGKTGTERAGTNKIEAQHVVKAVAEHARTCPDLSLGIVAFSKAQSDTLTEALEFERRKDAVLDAFLREGRSEGVFVKNIENVQGDERDVILISVGYGPTEPNGRLTSMSFGPVNGEGGERRLNVLFSRARVRCEVFASFDPGDIDPSRSTRVGPRVLKRFLDFAKTGVIEERVVTCLDADSPFEEDVASVIRSLGYEADLQVGTAGFRIDIGVRHPDRPGQYIVAVECDGAAYHSALWARERDRLRQDVLEGLGWSFHRIWSTDWFHRREQEIRRLADALAEAKDASADGIAVRGANTGGFIAPVLEDEAPPEAIEIGHLELTAPAYIRAELSVRASVEPHEAPQGQIGDLIVRIVDIEGPIHVDELARRITAAFGKTRTGARIVDTTMRALQAVQKRSDNRLRRVGEFVLNEEQLATPPVRDRRAETGAILKAEYLSPMEIAAAAARIKAESGLMPPEEMTRAVARLLGFQRVGPDLSAAILAIILAE
ncbi:DUF3320 domain-containing protein [Xinfangfangia sp. D13-10-4-6]|uniref:DUF3320 domain-containing protein n=1 Tax=Pseudogemmobacter hezensis TaxID=2737662 RepID=UPI001557B2F3|nr:DUF3320 domain-containing protein [Pseudogemmobacter hezensis]NPD16486.1 DUF3320 domain-containing protein [Pseudogemmobacter hezensis]